MFRLRSGACASVAFMKKETIRISSEDILRHASNEMHMRACIAGSRKQRAKKGKGSYTRKRKHRGREY